MEPTRPDIGSDFSQARQVKPGRGLGVISRSGALVGLLPILFSLFFLSAPSAECSGPGWTYMPIRGPGLLGFSPKENSFFLIAQRPGFVVASVFRRLDVPPGTGQIELSFDYESCSGFPLYLYVSAGSGWAVPSARTSLDTGPAKIEARRGIRLDIAGVDQGRGVWGQFFVAGNIRQGQEILVRNIDISLDADPALCPGCRIATGLATGIATGAALPGQGQRILIRGNVIHVRGKPFFPIGLFHVSDPVLDMINRENGAMGLAGVDRETALSQVAAHGFNVVHHSWKPGDADFYRAADRHKLMVVSEVGKLGPERIEPVKNMPGSLGWYGVDEPLRSNVPAMVRQYRAYKKADPSGLVMAAMDNGGVGFGCSRFVDVAMPDYYPVSGPESDLSMIAVFANNTYEYMCRDQDMAVVPVIQLFTCDGERWNGFSPTYAQVRAQVYTALCAGAKGIFYYAWFTHEPLNRGMEKNPGRKHWFLPESLLWDRIGELNAEVGSMSEALLAGWVVRAKTDPGQVMHRIIEHKGKLLLLAVNPLGRAKACIKLKDVKGRVKRLVPGPELTFSAPGVLTGTFNPYAACAYEIIPD